MTLGANVLDEIVKALGALETAVAVGTALSLSGIGRAVWARVTRATDEQFVLELDRHRKTVKRANAISRKASQTADDEMLAGDLEQLSIALRKEANERLRYAIVNARWTMTVLRFVGMWLGWFSPVLLAVAVAFVLQGRQEDAEAFATAWVVLTLIAVLNSSVVRFGWTTLEIRRMQRKAAAGAHREASAKQEQATPAESRAEAAAGRRRERQGMRR